MIGMLRSSDVIKVNNMYLKHLFAMRSGFDQRHVNAGFVVNRIGTGQVPPPPIISFYLSQYQFTIDSISRFILLLPALCNIIHWQRCWIKQFPPRVPETHSASRDTLCMTQWSAVFIVFISSVSMFLVSSSVTLRQAMCQQQKAG